MVSAAAAGAAADPANASAAPGEPAKQQLAQQPQPGGGGSEEGVLHFNWACREQRAQARSCMATLVAALADDPVNAYFSGAQRRRFVKDEVKGYLKALRGASNFIATPDAGCVALWQLLPQETPRNELLAGWSRILAVPPRLWRQLLRLELHYEAAHEATAAAHGAYYYLSFIGTAPEARGRGLGSRLLAHITRRADAEGRFCLLEATSEASQALYARHGFVTFEAFRVAPQAPPVFLMKRPPAAAPPSNAAAAAGDSAAAGAAAGAGAAAVMAPAVEAAAPASSLAGPLAAKLLQRLPGGGGGSGAGCAASECGSDASGLIAAGRVLDGDDDGDGSGEEEEQAEQSGTQAAACQPGAADAHVLIHSSSGGALAADARGAEAPGSRSDSQQQQQQQVCAESSALSRLGGVSSSPAGAGGPSATA